MYNGGSFWTHTHTQNQNRDFPGLQRCGTPRPMFPHVRRYDMFLYQPSAESARSRAIHPTAATTKALRVMFASRETNEWGSLQLVTKQNTVVTYHMHAIARDFPCTIISRTPKKQVSTESKARLATDDEINDARWSRLRKLGKKARWAHWFLRRSVGRGQILPLFVRFIHPTRYILLHCRCFVSLRGVHAYCCLSTK